MTRKRDTELIESPTGLENLAAAYRSMAPAMVTEQSRDRLLKMAERLEGRAKRWRAELERKI